MSRMPPKKSITASQEDYLETIYHIIAEKQAARAKDIAMAMKVKASSVTGALRVLAEKGLINYAPYDVITLTAEGVKAAEEVVRRHEVLNDFFSRILGVESGTAENAACEMEHALPQSVLDRLIQFVQFLDVCPRAGVDWIEAFRAFCREGVMEEKCVACTFQRLESLKEKRSSKLREGAPSIPMSELAPEQRGRIVKIKARGSVRDRLTEMSLAPGAIVKIEKIEGDQVEVRVKGYHRYIRVDDAERVIVEAL
jgi:DtxR family Mn-dependent transcriptional regulator